MFDAENTYLEEWEKVAEGILSKLKEGTDLFYCCYTKELYGSDNEILDFLA